MTLTHQVETLIACCYQTLDLMQREQGLTLIELGQTMTQREQLAEELGITLYRSGLISYPAKRLHTFIPKQTFTLIILSYIQQRPRHQTITRLTTLLAKDHHRGSTIQSKQANPSTKREAGSGDPVSPLPRDQRTRTGRTTHQRTGPRRDPRRTSRCDIDAV